MTWPKFKDFIQKNLRESRVFVNSDLKQNEEKIPVPGQISARVGRSPQIFAIDPIQI